MIGIIVGIIGSLIMSIIFTTIYLWNDTKEGIDKTK